MKKVKIFIFSLILTFISMFSCFATSYEESWSTPLTIRGFVSDQQSVAVIASYDFDITDDDVSYDSEGEGKTIASWNLTSHAYSSVTLKITASTMTGTATTNTLDYYIRFYYKYSTFSEYGIVNGNKSGYLETNSTEKEGESFTLDNFTNGESMPISFSSQAVKFMFMDGVDPSSSDYPDGDYTATVKIEIVGN